MRSGNKNTTRENVKRRRILLYHFVHVRPIKTNGKSSLLSKRVIIAYSVRPCHTTLRGTACTRRNRNSRGKPAKSSDSKNTRSVFGAVGSKPYDDGIRKPPSCGGGGGGEVTKEHKFLPGAASLEGAPEPGHRVLVVAGG